MRRRTELRTKRRIACEPQQRLRGRPKLTHHRGCRQPAAYAVTDDSADALCAKGNDVLPVAAGCERFDCVRIAHGGTGRQPRRPEKGVLQSQGDGERILKHIEKRARRAGFHSLFVLTTRTEHWFLKRGFVKATVDDLPKDRQKMYNWQRKSLVLIKQL